MRNHGKHTELEPEVKRESTCLELSLDIIQIYTTSPAG